jgi:hypothetical protein
VLSGLYRSGVVVKGACAAKAGNAHVIGNLIVTKGSVLAAAWGLNARTHKGGSSLTVTGSIVVNQGATAVLGCNPTESPCIDEPNMKHPTLQSSERVTGSLIENAPLAVLVHNTTIGGSVTQVGGGGGLSCAPPKTGLFAAVMSPVFSTYEDSSVGGNVTISGLKSCWLGMARVHVGGSASFINDQLGDPDAIEIVSNHIHKNLSCSGNSAVWDSHELSMTANFPRGAEPNTVGGKRSGQCTLSTPTTQGGHSGPGPF